MARLLTCKVNFKSVSGVVKENVNTSFSVICLNDASNLISVGNSIATGFGTHFLNPVRTGGKAISSYLGPTLSRAALDVSVSTYGPLTSAQMGGAIKGDGSTYLGSPIVVGFTTIGAVADSRELPRQAAVDIVLRANGWEVAPIEAADSVDPGSEVDRPRQRLTGRMKLGPWVDGTNAIGTGSESRPTSTLITALGEAINDFRDWLHAGSDLLDLAVWSRANRSMTAVTDVQIPNAFTSVIKRKPPVTARNLLAID